MANVDRPKMPGYGLLAANEGAGLMAWDDAEEKLVTARNYWVATTRPDGRPHAAPVWGLWLEGAFYFGTSPGSRKGRNLAANPEVAVHLESGDDVVIFEGRAEQTSDPAVLARINPVYEEKYDLEGGAGEGPVYVVRPRVAFAWLERDFPGTATRWRFA